MIPRAVHVLEALARSDTELAERGAVAALIVVNMSFERGAQRASLRYSVLSMPGRIRRRLA